MKKLLLVFGVLMGLVVLSAPSFALTAPNSSNKTSLNIPLVSSQTNGNTAFTTASTSVSVTGAGQFCSGSGATTFTGTSFGNLVSCGSTPITGLIMSGGASGGTVVIYDSNTNGNNANFAAEVGPQEAVFEATVAANTTTYIDAHDVPISTINGVVAYATSTSGVIVYTSKAIAINQ